MTGTSPERHPWFVPRAHRRAGLPPDAVEHRTITQNHGLLGGYLDCTFWTYPNGEPTHVTRTEWLEP